MNTPPQRIILAVTGASGSVYARLLTESLLAQDAVKEIALIFSANGRAVAEYEGQEIPQNDPRVRLFDNGDMFAPPASGSAGYDAMAVIPCSMGTIGRLAAGISDSLICRSADVMLKERRGLILVPRETPLHAIHLRNMTSLSECGAIIVPASPSFYSLPDGMDELCRSVTDRVVSLLGFDGPHYQWGR